jgi:hypothetical protein
VGNNAPSFVYRAVRGYFTLTLKARAGQLNCAE